MVDYSLYIATNDQITQKPQLCLETTEQIIKAGATVLQLRMKDHSSRAFFEMGRELLPLTRKYGVPLIINDRVDIMLALDADGVHIGSDDLPLPQVRKIVGEKKIVGFTAHSREELEYAENNGADYAGVGPVFQTTTKSIPSPALGLQGLRDLIEGIDIPCVAIGGINEENAADVLTTGVDGCCIISAVWSTPKPADSVRRINRAINKGFAK